MDKEDRISRQAVAIKQHIQHLLNSRQGLAPCAPDYGLQDFNDTTIGTNNMAAVIAEDIKEAISRFEPRIVITHVRHEHNVDNPLELKFVIEGFTLVENQREQLVFAMAVDRFGQQWRHF